MLRRPIVTFLTAALTLSLVASPATAEAEGDGRTACPDAAPATGFEDVDDDSTHAAAIRCATSLDVIRGTTDTTFDPAGDVTRGQVASLLARTLDEAHVPLPPTAGQPTFDDAGDAHGDAIHRLAAADIVAGLDDDTFAPNEPVTREQLASLLLRTWQVVLGDTVAAGSAGFDDVAAGGTHEAAIDAAVEVGLLVGRDADTFAPRETTRRDQAATAIVRVLDRAPSALVGEVWSLDQGTDLIHIYDGQDGDELTTIDLSPAALQADGFEDAPTGDATVPHMIEFDSQERYAFIAATAGASTIVIDARTKEVVEVLATGPGSHMAAVTPDDSAAWVAAIGGEQMIEIPLDLDADEPTFEIGRQLDVADLLAPIEADNDWEYPSYGAVCHQFSTDSTEAWVTLGPGWADGGVFVLDLESGTATHGWDPDVIKANCGVSVSDDHAIVNWSGEVVEGANTNGEWYVFDPETKEQIGEPRDALGHDAHGIRLSPDGSVYWMVNRASDNAIVVDAETLEVIDEYEGISDTPDILDFNADGSLVYISQRGPTPISGAPHAASGDAPGVLIVDAQSGEPVDLLAPPEATNDDGEVINDIHGVAFRIRGIGQ